MLNSGYCTLRFSAGALCVVLMTTAAAANDKTCAAELPKVEAEIRAMTGNADKNLAEHQYQKALERQAAGKEKSCLRYLESANAAIEAWRMHDSD